LSRCTAIKGSGERCKGRAIEGSEWCWNHHPSHADERRRHGARGGKRGGRGRPQAEISDIRRRLLDLADDVLEGRQDKGVAAVASQIFNVYLRAVSVELKVREQQEITERLQELETLLEQRKGERRYYGA
jgi:hypothetical protein